ncbi:MAG: ABC transporter substrate-binding protein [bacterium]
MKQGFAIGLLFFLALAKLTGQEGYTGIRSDETRVVNGKTYFVHEVKRGQTLYALSKAYGVEMQDIIDNNPDILQGLKAGQTLLIPSMIPVETPVVELPVEKQVIQEPPVGQPPPDARKEVYNVALMMHFYLNDLDSMRTDTPSSEEIEGYTSLRYIQFYEGFRLAVDSLGKTGMKLNLYVYDIDPDPAKTHRVLEKQEMAKMDLIIGMLFNRNFQVVAEYAREHHIPVISPVSEREAQIEGNPMVIKVRPAYSAEGIRVAEYLSGFYSLAHVVIISSPQPDMKTAAEQLYAQCKSAGLDVSFVGGSQMENQLLRGGDNIVVIVTNQKTYALEMLTRLNAITQDYWFEVIGLPRWDYFENLDFEYLVKTKAHIVAPFFVDYQDPHVKRFVSLFQQTYKTDPDNLAFQGFDVGWFFLNALELFGADFPGCLNALQIRPLQTQFKFKQNEGDGLENQHWEIYRFENYNLVHVEQ